jgi:hypothetical protein
MDWWLLFFLFSKPNAYSRFLQRLFKIRLSLLKTFSILNPVLDNITLPENNFSPDKTILKVNIFQADYNITLQRQNIEISKQIFPEKEYRGLSPNFHIHASGSDLYIPTMGLPILLEEICRPILGL